jgi:putative ABC transport system ATP-binding protein
MLEIKNLVKIYEGAEKLYALNNINLTINEGEIITIVGESGSGKTTFINCLGCLDNPTSGEIYIEKQKIFSNGIKLNEKELTKIRRKYFGYIFQKFFLIPTLSVKENILLPNIFQKEIKTNRVSEIMELLGILKRQNHLPSQLSGGEMQRVAIARALITEPKILIADEPTGNLDSKRSKEIENLLVKLNKDFGITIVLVTHNPEMAKIGKIIELKDGNII